MSHLSPALAPRPPPGIVATPSLVGSTTTRTRCRPCSTMRRPAGAVETTVSAISAALVRCPTACFLLIDRGVQVMQGNYDHSIGHQLADCACGYSDPRATTTTRGSPMPIPRARPRTLAALPARSASGVASRLGGYRVHMAHGSPRQGERISVGRRQARTRSCAACLSPMRPTCFWSRTPGFPWVRKLPAEQGGDWWSTWGRSVVRRTMATGVWYALLDVPPPDPTEDAAGFAAASAGQSRDFGHAAARRL